MLLRKPNLEAVRTGSVFTVFETRSFHNSVINCKLLDFSMEFGVHSENSFLCVIAHN